MNEILGIYFKKELSQQITQKAFKNFEKDYPKLCYYYSSHFQVLLGSKTHLKSFITEGQKFVSCFGGYILNNKSISLINIDDIAMLHGKFLFVKYNKLDHELNLYSDILGNFPVYYISNDKYFAFSSNLKYLLQLKDIDKTLNPQYVYDYFYWGTTLPYHTFFENINLLPPFTNVQIGKNNIEKHTARSNQSKTNQFHSIDESVSNLLEALDSLINSYHAYYGKLNFTMTGGLDTRILGSFNKATWHSKFITVHHSNLSESENSDIQIAKKVAKLLQVPHETIYNSFFPIPELFSQNYFKDVKFKSDFYPVITGIFGSELLKLQAFDILKRNLSLLSIKNHYKHYDTNLLPSDLTPQLNTFLKNNAFNFKKMIKTKSQFKNFNERKKQTINDFEKDIATNPLKTIFKWVANSYYSTYYGGSRAGNFNHYELFSIFLIPFADQKIIDVLSKIPCKFYGIHYNSIISYIYRSKLKYLTSIDTNTSLVESYDKLFKQDTYYRNPIYYRSNNDQELFEYYKNYSRIYDLEIFNNDMLRQNMNQFNNIRNSFIDFSVWLDFVYNPE